MSFLFPKRSTTGENERERETANRREFDGMADAIRTAYSQAQDQPKATLAAIQDLFGKLKATRTLDKRQREILIAYINDAAGYANLEVGRINEGLAVMKKASQTYESLPDKTLLVNNLLNQSRGWLMRNDLTKALACLERGLAITKEGRLSQLEADVLYKLGVLYTLTGRNDKAQEIFGRGLLLTQQTGNQNATATFLSQFGQLNLQKGDLDKAEDYYDRSRAIFEQLNDLDNLLVSYGQLDQLYRRRGDKIKALEYGYKGLELAREQSNHREENVFLQDLAMIYYAQDDYVQAERLAWQSLKLALQLNDSENQMRAYGLLAQISLQQKDYAAAQSCAEKGYEQAKKAGNQREMAVFLNDFAEIKLAQGDIVGGLAEFERLGTLFKEMEDRAMLATLYVRMGDTYLEALKDPVGAARMATMAFELARGQDGEAAMFAFTSMMRLVQLLAVHRYYEEGLRVAGRCLEQANAELRARAKAKRTKPEQQGRWLLFVQVLILLVGTLQDLKTGQPEYQPKVKEILGQLVSRFGDTFTLETWTTEMYERIK